MGKCSKSLRNSYQDDKGLPLPRAQSAVQRSSGVCGIFLSAGSRATTGIIVANKNCKEVRWSRADLGSYLTECRQRSSTCASRDWNSWFIPSVHRWSGIKGPRRRIYNVADRGFGGMTGMGATPFVGLLPLPVMKSGTSICTSSLQSFHTVSGIDPRNLHRRHQATFTNTSTSSSTSSSPLHPRPCLDNNRSCTTPSTPGASGSSGREREGHES